MNYSLSNMLSSNASGIDPDAKAYIAAVVAAGGTVSGTQKNAINTFYKTGKSDGWYSSLKRLYLPIWGVAAPNAIDMIGGTSGTFVGGVTHSTGYVTTNATTGHFLSDISPGGAGLTLNGSGVFALYTGALPLLLINSQHYFGSSTNDAGTRIRLTGGTAESARFSFFGPNNATFSTFSTSGDQRGVSFLGRDTSTNRFVILRQTSTLLSLNSTNTSGSLNSTTPMCWLANNSNGTIGSYVTTTARLGCAGMAEGLSQANAETVTSAIKTLWESTTGLTLP